MQHIRAEKCSFGEFSQRLLAIDAACCARKHGNACPRGVPSDCSFVCAEKYIPLYNQCHELLVKMVGKSEVPQFEKLHAQCITSAAPAISRVYRTARSHSNCVLDATFVDQRGLPALQPGGKPSAGAGNGHRRMQFGHMAHNNVKCPFSSFTSRVSAVNKACGLDASSAMPSHCSAQCAMLLNPFYDDCRSLVKRFLDKEMALFTALHNQCAEVGTVEALYTLESLSCDNTAYTPSQKQCPTRSPRSCSEIKHDRPAACDGYYTIDPDGPGQGVAAFSVWCDMTTEGGKVSPVHC
jgi:hypothetical protein